MFTKSSNQTGICAAPEMCFAQIAAHQIPDAFPERFGVGMDQASSRHATPPEKILRGEAKKLATCAKSLGK